ncbi:hypothetical protein KBE46_02805 [Candidatus Saccharibacteria bacterium]|nr:hypothetical protein [Candidatus Saccharibacteria bacterium]
MNKEVIYIDSEDDITDVISKVKSAKEKIVALVPPKGIGVLSSPVNLRLLQRTSDQSEKKVVLISNDSTLRTMAASAKIPIAKTLQSKPEIPEIDALEVDGDDIIDGEKLPISAFTKKPKEDDSLLDNIDIDDNKAFSKKDPKNAKKKGAKNKIPDFNKFRKKLFIIGGAAIILIGFLVWAIWFAPAATIIINAKTSTVNVKDVINLTTDSKLAKPEEGTLLAKTESTQKDAEVSFDATGTKDVGEKAKGTLTLSQNTESDGIAVAAGTGFSSGDCTFITQKSVVIPGVKFTGGKPQGTGEVDVAVVASDVGEQCNLSGRTYLSPISAVSANGTAMSGGSKKTIKVVTNEDLESAKQKLASNSNDNVKAELTSKFGSGYKVIGESFAANAADPVVSPAVGEEASSGKATVKANTTYTLTAIENTQLSKFLESAIKDKMEDKDNQKVYKNGLDEVSLTGYAAGNGAMSIGISTNGKVGPNIDEQKIKDQSKKKEYGEVQSQIESIEGVNSVDVKFSFFWVTKVPDNDNKITIEFTVDN